MFRINRSPLTAALLAFITIIFVFEWLSGALWNPEKMIQFGAIVPGMLERREFWRIFAAMFLHGSFIHWAANSWTLYQLGSLYESMFGTRRFAIVYFTTGAIASIASSLFVEGASVGASGAILGILGAFIFSIKRSPMWRNEPWTKGLVSQLIFWAVLNLAIGFSTTYIDNVAHIAGLVSGLLLGLLPHRVPPPPPSRNVIDVVPYE